jgi:hypothetical protein
VNTIHKGIPVLLGAIIQYSYASEDKVTEWTLTMLGKETHAVFDKQGLDHTRVFVEILANIA